MGPFGRAPAPAEKVEPELEQVELILWLHRLYLLTVKAGFTTLTFYNVELLHLQNIW
jgi:hypothetical protein